MQLFRAQMKIHEWVVRFFSSLSHYAIGHPRRILLIAGLVTLGVSPGLWRLKLRTDGHALVAQNAPEVLYDKEIRRQFGIEDNIVVLIQSGHPDGIFNPGTVQLVRDLTAQFTQLPGINASNVMSLATEPSFRFRPGTLINQKLLEPPLKTKVELDQLREDVRRIELYTGTFLAKDGRSTVILIGAPSGQDRTRLYQKILDIIAACQPGTDTISVTGAPVAESLLGIHILEDLGVPRALLGTSTRSRDESGVGKFPRSLYELRLFIARRIGLVPVAMAVMMIIFFLTFRRVLATLLPLPEVAATLVFVFGLMGICGVPIYLTIAVMPVLLTAMCITDEIHVFSRYFALLREKPGVSHVEMVKETVDEMVCPVANTTLTTAIGFVSFAFSPLAPVQAFGIFTAIGVLFSLFYSLTVVPAMLTLIDPKWLLSRRSPGAKDSQGWLAEAFARQGLQVVRHRFWVLGAILLVMVLTPFGLRRLVIQDSWIDGFDPSSEFRRTTALVNDQFRGMHLLFVSLDAPKVISGELAASAISSSSIILPASLMESPAVIEGSAITLSISNQSPAGPASNAPMPAVWRSHIEMASQSEGRIFARVRGNESMPAFWDKLNKAGGGHFEIVVRSHVRPELIRMTGELGSFIRERRQYAVGGVLSPEEYLTTTRFMVRSSDPTARRLPDDPGEIKILWDYYGLARGPQRLHQIVDTNYWRSLTTVFLNNANFIDTAKLMDDIHAYEREHLTPKRIKIGFAGDVAVSQSLIRGIVTTQMQSLVWSLVGIYLVTAILGRSLRWGIYCVLPSTLAVLINFAVMGWFGIPLGVATSMFAGMTLGIGVDFAIHVVEGYGFARAGGASLTEALSRSMALTGPPVLINTVAVSCGFGVLMLSQVPANARLGLLVVLGLVDCLIASLLILPVLLHWWPLRDPREKTESTNIHLPTPRENSNLNFQNPTTGGTTSTSSETL
jgi:predicted RND superfamily exporter protein